MYILDSRPWKLPAPFVGMMFKAFFGLILLANANAVYERLEILGIGAVYIFLLNISLVSQHIIRNRVLLRVSS